METRWRETLDPKNGGGTVQVKIELIYSDDKKRPDFFIVNQTINGKELDSILLENKPKPTEE